MRLHLEQIDALDRAIAEIDREVEANLDPFRALIPVLTGIPGIGDLAARYVSRDRHRYEPVSDGRASGLLGRPPVPQER